MPFLWWLHQEPVGWAVWAAWAVLCTTDLFDGVLARRHGRTRSGAFLDPLADKVLVLGGMSTLVIAGSLWWVPVAIIAVREVAMSVYRTYVGRRGVSVPANRPAKVKTLVPVRRRRYCDAPSDGRAPARRRDVRVGRGRADARDRRAVRGRGSAAARRVAGAGSRRPSHSSVRCEVVAVGTELLLGQIVDTNSSWIGQHLADIGINSHFQTKVGDNLDRIVGALRTALARSDAVIVCGGLGPTQDDITREAIAAVMNVPLERDEAMVDTIAEMFMSRGRDFPMSNARQADKPVGSEFIVNPMGTAPGLICPVGLKVVYAVPGVPYEMEDMLQAGRAARPAAPLRFGLDDS